MADTVLIIDDDELVRDALSRTFSSDGYEAHTAADGAEGIDSFKKLAPALVIVDILMPEKEGIETILAIRKLDADARIVAISGGGRTGNMDFLDIAKKCGASETLSKPFGKNQLLSVARKLLDRP